MPVCFVICPIGESNSEIRQNSNDLLDLIIKPVLQPFGFTVVRGDDHIENGQIDMDVIREVQEADLCIVDLSLPNPNVYYEFGRRDETGKPLLLLKAKGSVELPVDVATRRYIEYDLDSRRGLIDAREQMVNAIEPLIEKGFESSGTGASLSELAEILRRVERKIDRIGKKASQSAVPASSGAMIDDNTDPVDLYKYAIRTRNIPEAERAMDILRFRMELNKWLDQVVGSVAAMGSSKAGDILIEHAFDFIDSNYSFKDKMDYLGCLVSNLNRTDRELEHIDLVERMCDSLKAVSENEPVSERIQVHNQLNRLYHGIYVTTKDVSWLEKAIIQLREGLKLNNEANYLHYNLAMCLKERNHNDDASVALKHILHCVELDGNDYDDDHLQMACELLYRFDDERLDEYVSMLESVNAIKAKLLRDRWRR